MTQAQAARTSMPEYLMRVEGKQAETRESYELARWTVWHHYHLSPWIKPGQRPSHPTDIILFDWEKGKVKKKRITRKDARVSDKERSALESIIKDFYNRKYSS